MGRGRDPPLAEGGGAFASLPRGLFGVNGSGSDACKREWSSAANRSRHLGACRCCPHAARRVRPPCRAGWIPGEVVRIEPGTNRKVGNSQDTAHGTANALAV